MYEYLFTPKIWTTSFDTYKIAPRRDTIMTATECPSIDLPPEPLLAIDADDIDNNVRYVHRLAETNAEFAAPIDIDVVAAIGIGLPLLEWHHYEVMPRKMRLTNTGQTRKRGCCHGTFELENIANFFLVLISQRQVE